MTSRITLTQLICCAVLCISLPLAGCASGSHASEGAKRGATQGAVAGAMGGLVSALVFGGDPLDRAARGAVYGGTTGAVAGGMAGAERDKAERARQESSLAALRQEIGEDSFEGLVALAECRHDDVLPHAAAAKSSANPNFKLSGMWLEVLTLADRGDEASARSHFPELVEADWDIKSETEAEAAMRGALGELMKIRGEYRLPQVCPR